MAPRTTIRRARPRLPLPANAAQYDPYALAALMGVLPTVGQRLPVTERTLLGLPAANAAVQRIANNVAQMLVGADALGPDARTPLDPIPLIVSEPCVGLDSFTFWKMMVATGLMRGNAIGIKAMPDRAGYPTQVIPVPVEAVHAYYDGDGYLRYEVNGEDTDPDYLVHVRIGITLPGNPWTIGVIEAHRRGLAAMLDQQGMAADVWRNGAIPSGLVQIEVNDPSEAQAATVKRNWIGALGGQRTVAVIGKNMTYTPIAWNANDAQFIESRQFTVAETALMFGLRPEDLGATVGGSAQMTYGNRTDDNLQRIVDAYTPVMLPFEQQWSRLLPGRNFVRGNPEALLRATTRERYEVHEIAQRIGLQTAEETRALEGKPPATTEPPPPPPNPPEPPAPKEDPDDA